MPSTSAKQAKFMKAVANNPKFAKKVGVPQSVGKDFEMADKKKGKKFGSGGAAKKPMMESDRKPIDMRRAILGSDKDIVARGNRTPYEPIPKKGPEKPKQKLGRMGEKGYAKGGKVKKYALGGNLAGGPTKTTPTQSGSGNASSAPVVSSPKPVGPKFGMYMDSAPSASPTTSGLPGTSGVQLPAGKPAMAALTPANAPTSTAPRTFDRNAAYKAFNARAGELAKQGVSSKAIAQQQAILRKLQMNNSSTPQQHRQAFDAALAALKPTAPFSGNTLGALKSMAPQYAKGGKVMKKSDKKGGEVMKKSDKAGRALVKKSADTMGRAMMKKAGGGKCYAKGGSVSSRADGVAKKGKTHTKMVTMRKGGSC